MEISQKSVKVSTETRLVSYIHGKWTSRCVLTIQEVRMEHRGSWECEVNMINNEDDNHATWHDLLLAELSPKAKGLKSAGARGLQRGMARHGVQSTSRRKRGSATMTMTKTKTKTKCFNHVFVGPIGCRPYSCFFLLLLLLLLILLLFFFFFSPIKAYLLPAAL